MGLRHGSGENKHGLIIRALLTLIVHVLLSVSANRRVTHRTETEMHEHEVLQGVVSHR